MATDLPAAGPSSVVVIEHGRNPSSDYYVLPHVRRRGLPLRLIDGSAGAPAALAPGSEVVIVRYLSAAWARRIDADRDSLAGVAYFMDDDLLDASALAALPLPYAARIVWLALRWRAWLRRIGARLWVSTPYLAAKYRDWNAELLPLQPEAAALVRPASTRIFYHGTGLHAREIDWLAPVVAEVQSRCEASAFEIFGRRRVIRRFAKIPRVAVLHPMPWESYRYHAATANLDVGLAPLLDHRFNAARSHSKFFDIARCGGVGIYSAVEPYASFVRDGVDGLLLENDADTWVKAILRLVSDAESRQRMAGEARQRALALCAGDRD